MLKAHAGIAQVLWKIIAKSWKTEHLPEDLKVAQIVPLYKYKAKRTECSKYCGISLLSVPRKLFAGTTLNRCKEAVDKVLRDKQCGFRKSRAERDRMYEILRRYGLLVKVVKVIRNIYDGFRCRVKSEGVIGDTFDVRAGVRQGDVWAPFLLRLVNNYVLANSVRDGKDIGQNVADLDFADDVPFWEIVIWMLRRSYICLKKLLRRLVS
ncbi:uncharacterized protein LOC142340299 [Convolutriloba macropyga]|uniref:uncharacterized protein LOC142340299 n=1 Tax=Convolutriloba macropyga TaxID=536237 RepID=UPI003F528F9D